MVTTALSAPNIREFARCIALVTIDVGRSTPAMTSTSGYKSCMMRIDRARRSRGGHRIGQHEGRRDGKHDISAAQPDEKRQSCPQGEGDFGYRALEKRSLAR